MKIRASYIAAAAALALSGTANAAIVQYQITGGNWDSIAQWTAQASGAPSTFVYDNGATPPCINCAPAPFDWATSPPPAMNGTYGGIISVDTNTNIVVGGALSVTGSIADMVFVGTTWWVREYQNLNIDFSTNLATASGIGCYATTSAPVGCGPAVTGGAPGSFFSPKAGLASQGPGGTFYNTATFDANTGLLQIFRDGRTYNETTMTASGTDTLNNFTLQAQVVPVPAAVWLFGSALGLLGVARRKLAA